MPIAKMIIYTLLSLVLCRSISAAPTTQEAGAHPAIHVNHAALKKLNWQLAAGTATFRQLTTFAMIDLLHSLDFHHLELAPGQVLSADRKDVRIGHEMQSADVDALLAKLKSVKMDVVSYGPVPLGTDEAEDRRAFEFAKKLKLKTITVNSWPTPEAPDKLPDEFGINAALVIPPDRQSFDQTLEALIKSME